MATQLKDFRNALAAVAGDSFRSETNAKIGVALEGLALREFKDSSGPYGNAWKPVGRLSKRLSRGRSGPRRRGTPLVKTGALRASHVSSGSADGVRIGFADPVAIFHQKGTPTIDKRQILPEATTGGLPPAWLAEIQRVHAACVRRCLRAA
jgi:phage gpG-like protein